MTMQYYINNKSGDQRDSIHVTAPHVMPTPLSYVVELLRVTHNFCLSFLYSPL